jgi:hypothetical protein
MTKDKNSQSDWIKRISTDAGVSCAAASPAWASEGEHWYELSVDPGIVTDEQTHSLDKLRNLIPRDAPSPLPKDLPKLKAENEDTRNVHLRMAKERTISVRMFERGFLRNAMERFCLVLRLDEICQQYLENKNQLRQWQREFQAGGLELFRSTVRNTFGKWSHKALVSYNF